MAVELWLKCSVGAESLSDEFFASLQDLRPCVNLKWLSVVQNKLQSLKGVEALSKLTVSDC